MTISQNLFKIARVSAVDEKRGYFILELFTDYPEKLNSLHEVYIEIQGKLKKITVEDVIIKKNSFAVKFKGFNPGSDKVLFLNADLLLPNEQMQPLPEGSWFIHDLIGSSVYKNGMLFGTIEDVLSLKTNDVYQIKKVNGEEYLLPALKQYITEFRAEEKALFLTDGEEYYED